MLIEVDQQLTIPAATEITSLRPGLVLWSNTPRTVYFVELTVPWEDAVDEANKRKRLWYAEMAAE